MKAPSDEMAMRPLTEGTKRRTGLEKRLAWELERWAQALVLSDPVPTLRKTRRGRAVLQTGQGPLERVSEARRALVK